MSDGVDAVGGAGRRAAMGVKLVSALLGGGHFPTVAPDWWCCADWALVGVGFDSACSGYGR